MEKRSCIMRVVSFVTVLIVFLNCQFASSAELTPQQKEFQNHKNELQELKSLAEEGGHPHPEKIAKFDPDVCYTSDCIEAAKEFMTATSFKEDPCQSGNWLKFTCVRRTQHKEGQDELDDMHQQSQVGYLGSVAIGQTLAMLESRNATNPIMHKARVYYEQCENWTRKTPDDKKVDMIVAYLKGFGEWPLLTGSQSPGERFDWKKLAANNVRIAVAYGVAPYLFDIFIEEGDVPLLFTGELSLHKDNAEIVEVINILSKGERKVEENDKQIKEMRDFMVKLTHPSEERIETHSLKNISQHHDFGKNFSLQNFYALMLAGTRLKITPDSNVAADFDWLAEHVRAVNEANPRVIANILFLQAAAALLTRLTTTTHLQHLTGLEKYRSHGPMDCVRETYEKFDFAMSNEYLHRYYDHQRTTALVHIMEDLKKGYVDVLEKANFLTSQTKVHAINKANDIHTFIGADSWVMEEDKLKDYYKNMNVSKDYNFIENHVAGLRFHWVKFLELTNANIFNYLVGDAYTGYVSAKYSYHFNQIRVQAALVQKPLFGKNYPSFMNYGGIGTVISHSLGHSFDTNGVHFDKNGHRGDFWDDNSYEGYYNWTDSLIKDYNGPEYKKPDPWGSLADADIDHAQTVNDDVADAVGVRMAYFAYEHHLGEMQKAGQKEKVLPGLKQFSPKQLFWMKYASMWCEHTEKSYLHVLRHFDQHSPGNVRATLPLTRSREWVTDFKCAPPKKSDF